MRRSPRLIIALFIALVALAGYYSQRQENPVTGEVQHVALSSDQEVALGLNAAPQMASQFGGLDDDPRVQGLADTVGRRIVENSAAGKSDYKFQFNVLADRQTINAFALPGGPVFITRGLLDRLQNEAQLAGVLGHEVGHVVGRHAAEHMAKTQLGQAMVGAVAVGASDDPRRGYTAAMMAQFVSQMLQLRYGRNDELESDRLGVRFMAESGYDPHALIGVMDILEKAGGGGHQPEFMSTHPNPGNRREQIQAAIRDMFPNGVPAGLEGGTRVQEGKY